MTRPYKRSFTDKCHKEDIGFETFRESYLRVCDVNNSVYGNQHHYIILFSYRPRNYLYYTILAVKRVTLGESESDSDSVLAKEGFVETLIKKSLTLHYNMNFRNLKSWKSSFFVIQTLMREFSEISWKQFNFVLKYE